MAKQDISKCFDLKKGATIIWVMLMWLLPSHINGQWNRTNANKFISDAIANSSQYNTDSIFQLSDSLVNYIDAAEDPCLYVRAMAFYGQMLGLKSLDDEALKACIEADKVASKASCQPSTKAYLNFVFSSVYHQVASYDKSIQSAKKALSICKGGTCDTLLLIKIHGLLGVMNNISAEEKIAHLDTALSLATLINNGYWIMRMEVNLSSAFAMQGDFKQGTYYAKRGIKSAIAIKAYIETAVLYNNLAGMSASNDTILALVDSAIFYAEKANSVSNQQAFTQNKALFYSMIGEWENGYITLWKALTLKDTLFKQMQIDVIAEMDEKYEAEKRIAEIERLKVKSLNAELEKVRYERNQGLFFVGSGILVLAVAFLSFSIFSIRRNRNALAAKNIIISEERKRSDELLLNILPAEIAQELKETGKAQTRYFNSVTIMFTDFVDFTAIANSFSTNELIDELNICFKQFDDITQRYGLEKIKTIGDSYMAAGGIPIERSNVVQSAVLAALDMQAFMIERKSARQKDGKICFDMRVGIHTGPVVAGIVGVKKFQYDIWGDTVNTASRMENTCESGQVNISATSYEELKNDPEFTFMPRGSIEVKGKGLLEMYYVSKTEKAA